MTKTWSGKLRYLESWSWFISQKYAWIRGHGIFKALAMSTTRPSHSRSVFLVNFLRNFLPPIHLSHVNWPC